VAPLTNDDSANPYSPPGSDLNAGHPSAGAAALADRGTRLGAAMIDGLLVSIPLLPVLGVVLYFVTRVPGMGADGVNPEPGEALIATLVGVTAFGLLAALGIAIYQWVLISRTGQSLGKKWLGIRIERIDGAQVTFGTGVFLRNWVPKLIGSVPYLGALFQLIDCLFIFRDDRRCIHDHIAGTRVVRQLR
jgi:uncharacterized RDD family membrane protein YckC